ncbi:MAG: dienelactone hydrolase family protein [Acidimicrobiaceae bacterium]|nr:dienelactone hydrolase family protein [Acidimicrobiaceae bacterium]MCO5331998.1 dienelactone hydrolase family protein [Ilumatobacteraceae bacterium]
MSDALEGWSQSSFTAAGLTRDVYRRGSGPGVVVIHEIPGITPKVAQFMNEVVDAGFTVVAPSLVGTPGRDVSNGYVLGSMLKVCVAKEFANWALDRTSPVIGFLRALARNLHDEVGGPGVGAVGMCFSGGFALGMMVDDIMVAPVLSQPSMPFAAGFGSRKVRRSADLNLSPDDRLAVARRAAEGCQVLGLRFTGDTLVGTRFDSLRELLGDRFIAVELPSTTKRDHSVLTEQRDEASVQQVLQFLQGKLHG